uniref:Porflan n=1 Tax=Potamotrygon orbignyi TaxID=86381 RepID=PORFL_POTOR|nr:RecName: Full=Porflan [Potamotrygon orbignyi]
ESIVRPPPVEAKVEETPE